MNVKVFTIEKSSDKALDAIAGEYTKMISRFAKVEEIKIFNKQIASAQMIGEKEARASYTKAYESHLKGYNVALDVEGEQLNSEQFSTLFDQDVSINFFIGGAFGFEEGFLSKTQKIISLSRLTYAHKIAKVVLFEQIYRGLCIKNNHPYHK
ncbi:23S rRNA (pseudouridine(1915)-N(3))-methyltransferase RlmH [Sulfurospirillum halorespirans]|uniref:Ribosomal RNA large subunit methyltransferase H n=1 Tax=Sulfurospirillum halorespirans DSM 13726 TaxID=1193502 RepID=A0A1D7THM4_9BACT|nr:23S rRNA (pseudouridine(1915)-N(3))-methyltransferase RlmH [Sulfurospirillum halorespirans]AOO64483.1 ribosomal RNA large subunit methyltransferase H [Sulfurospirillum halorespirans DSM 13726]